MGSKKKKVEDVVKINWVKMIWIGVLTFLILTGLIFLFISKFLLPDTSELERPKYDLATQVLSSDGKVIGKAYTQNREWLSFDEINPNLVNALVAVEDERFFEHSGIDIRGLGRAFFYFGKNGGASTITQQLAKQFFTKRSRTFVKRVWQKLKEWVIAVEFEKRYTKGEIIAMYLNKYDFIYESIGVATAAKTYFGKDQKDLTIDEAAVLVGMLKSPTLYNPKRNMERAVKRKGIVLNQMFRNKFITQGELDKLKQKPIDLSNFKRDVHYDNAAPYFNAELIKTVKKILNSGEISKPDGSKYNVYTDGLKIYSTLDSRIQEYANQSMRQHMAHQQEKYFKVWKNRDPWLYNNEGRASKQEIKDRERQLQRDIRSSERFKKLRTSYLSKVSNKIYDEIPGSTLSDTDIFRLFNAEKNSKFIATGAKKKQFSKEKAAMYQDILDSKYWSELKKQWQSLRARSKKVFNSPVSMKIYDYKTGNDKKVKLSPRDSIKYHQQILQIGSVVLDSKSGDVKAWVGGVKYKHFQYDHVTSNRQVGSTFKPFIYGTAIIDLALSPCSKFQDIKTCIPAGDPKFGLMKTWCPKNSNNIYSNELMTMRRALQKSTNTVSVQLIKEIGNVERVRDFVGNIGINKKRIPSAPSICLGTPALSVLDMAGSYTAFANNGTYSKPRLISRIEDKNGKIIYESVPEQKKAINPAFNFVIVDLLKSVVQGHQSRYNSTIAGKTGTTDDYRDGWFVGFTPNLIISTWVGGEREIVHFSRLGDGAGSQMARPMFFSLLSKIEKDNSLGYDYSLEFEEPTSPIVELDCSKYDDIIKQDSIQDSIDEQFDEEF